jgi:hypothetical protein
VAGRSSLPGLGWRRSPPSLGSPRPPRGARPASAAACPTGRGAAAVQPPGAQRRRRSCGRGQGSAASVRRAPATAASTIPPASPTSTASSSVARARPRSCALARSQTALTSLPVGGRPPRTVRGPVGQLGWVHLLVPPAGRRPPTAKAVVPPGRRGAKRGSRWPNGGYYHPRPAGEPPCRVVAGA